VADEPLFFIFKKGVTNMSDNKSKGFSSLIKNIFNRRKNDIIKNLEKEKLANKKNIISLLNSNKYNFFISNEFVSRYYNKFLNTNDGLKNKIYDYEAMYKDPILSMAFEFIIDDSTQYSMITKKRIWGISNDSLFVDIINNLFSSINIQSKIWFLMALVGLYGNCFIRIYYKNEDFSGGISFIEIERDMFRYIPIEVNGEIIKFIDRYTNEILEAFEVIVIKINMLNDYRLINDFYDIEINVNNFSGKKMTKRNSFEYGTSFFENCRRVWKQRLLAEDSLMLARLENSPKLKLYKVNVEGMSDEAGADLVNYYTDLLSYSNKVVNEAENLIRGADTQITYGAKIVLPTNGNEGLTVEEFGGDAEISGIEDLERLDKIFYASLRVPPEFLGLGESGGLNIGETSIIRKEIRYARTCKKLQYEVIKGIKDLVYYNFLSIGIDVNYETDFDIVMNIVSTAEEEEFKNALKNSMEVSTSFLSLLNDIKNLLGEDKKFKDEDIVNLIYFITNKILNLNDIDWNKIINNLMTEEEDKGKSEEGSEEGIEGEEEGSEMSGEEGMGGEEESSEMGGETGNEENVGIGGEEENIPEQEPKLEEGRKILKKKIFESKSYERLNNKEKIKVYNYMINYLSRKCYNIPSYEFTNNLKFIKESLLKKERNVIVEGYNNSKIELNCDNLNKIIGSCNKFDLNIFKNVKIYDNFYLNDYKIDKIYEVENIKNLYFVEFFISVIDVINSDVNDIITVYKLEDNKYIINYLETCKYLNNLLKKHKFIYKVIELKK